MLDSRVTRENIIVGVVGEDGIDDELLPIGHFARLSGLSVHTLRHYDDVGLLDPDHVDPDTGYRRYSRTQVPRARLITDEPDRPGPSTFGLPVQDLEAALNAGGTEITQPRDAEGMPRTSAVKDPSGNWIWLYQG